MGLRDSLLSKRGGEQSGEAIRFDDVVQTKLETWVGKIVDKGPIGKLSLHLVGPSGNQNVGEWDEFEGMAPANIAEAIYERANDDAKYQRGAPRYVVCAYRKNESAYASREWFRLKGGADEFDGIEDTETPDSRGITGQHMRHTEMAIRMSLMSYHQIIQAQRRENEELRAFVRHSISQQFKVVEVFERMMSEEQRRKLDMRKEMFSEARGEKLWDHLMLLVPIALKHLADGKGKGAESAATEALIANVLSTLDQNQIGQLIQVLKPAQQAAFFELYKKIRDQSPKSVAEDIKKKETEIETEAEAEKAEREKNKDEGQE